MNESPTQQLCRRARLFQPGAQGITVAVRGGQLGTQRAQRCGVLRPLELHICVGGLQRRRPLRLQLGSAVQLRPQLCVLFV